MLVFLSREGVVFLVSLSSSHFTEIHVFPPPVSEANWRSLFRPGDSPPSFPKMASSFTGSAHSPFSGYDTVLIAISSHTLSFLIALAAVYIFSTNYELILITPAPFSRIKRISGHSHRSVKKGLISFKGPSHQIRSAWIWYGRIGLGRDMRRWTF